MANQNKIHRICIEPEGKDISAPSGSALVDILQSSGYPVILPCGGNGSCGKCLVKFLSGAPEPLYEETLFITRKQLDNGMRLACLSRIRNNARLAIDRIREISGEQILTTGRSHQIKPEPAVSKKTAAVAPASLDRLKSDEQIILQDGDVLIENLEILRQLPGFIHQGRPRVTLTFYKRKVISVEPGDTRNSMYGIALDLGTTTIVFSIIDLIHCKTLYLHAGSNPQRQFGDDLISRLTYAGGGADHLQKLRAGVIDYLNHTVHKGCEEAKISPHDLFMLTVSGNTVMNHIFLGVDPRRIGHAPYTPVFTHARSFTAEQLDLKIHPHAPVFISPNIGGFVGGDIISDMLVAGFGHRSKGIRLLIDIGTNCEVVLEKEGVLWAASSPAGPALEGACISNGMRAAPGAILDAHINEGELELQTINHQSPKGICGSGLFHLADLFYRIRFIDANGRINKPERIADPIFRHLAESRIAVRNDNPQSITVFNGIRLTQTDIREFQLAKAAIASAWEFLCEIAGCQPTDIENVYIAGAFGNYIRPQAAINLGLIPALELNRVHFIGNASLEGARMMLLNRKYQQAADRMAKRTNFIELAGRHEFQEKFVQNMRLGKLQKKIMV